MGAWEKRAGARRLPTRHVLLTAALSCALTLLLAAPALAGSWTVQGAGVTPYDLRDVAAPNLSTAAAAGDFGRVLSTANGGTLWIERTPAPAGHFQGVAFYDAGNGLAVGSSGMIYANAGDPTAWTVKTSGVGVNLYGVAYGDTAATACAVGTGGLILRTTDGGDTWGQPTSPTTAVLRAVAFDSNGTNCVAVGDGGVIARSADSGATWGTVTSTTSYDLKDVAFASSTNGWAVGAYDTILATTDGGATWSTVTHTGNGDNLNGIAATDTSHAWAVGDNGTVLYTRNAGSTWTVTTGVPTTRDLFATAFADNGHGWAVGARGTIIKYVYDAPTIAISGSDGAWHTPPVTLAFTATCDPDLTVSSMEYSTDGGGTWTEIPGSGASRTLAISTQGATTVTARATDSAAQVSSTPQTIVRVDAVQPTVAVSGAPSSWACAPVALTFTTAQGPSGIGSVQYQADGGAWLSAAGSGSTFVGAVAGDGAHTVAYKAISGAGVVSDVGSVNVYIDGIFPSVAVHGVPAGWSAKAVTIHFHAAHGPSGIAAMLYQSDGSSWHQATGSGSDYHHAISAKGSHTVHYLATSVAGLSSATGTVHVKIDPTKPEANASCKPLPNKNGYSKGTVNVILRKKNLGPSGAFLYYRLGGSGAYLKYKRTIPVEADGVTKVYYYAQSGAGVRSKTRTMSVRIDSTIPLSDVLSKNVTTVPNRTVTLRYRIEDDFCPKAKVQLAIYATEGRKETRMNLGLVPTNKDLSCRIKVGAKPGQYTFTFYATNLAGTIDPMPERGTITVL